MDMSIETMKHLERKVEVIPIFDFSNIAFTGCDNDKITFETIRFEIKFATLPLTIFCVFNYIKDVDANDESDDNDEQ